MSLLFTDQFRDAVSGEPLVYIDAGARGGLEGPWAEIADARLFTVAFEPEPEAAESLRNTARSPIHVVPKALWSNAGTTTLHVAVQPGASSIHSPNFSVLERFESARGALRRTAKTISVDTVTLDETLAAIGRHADFIKIDTHGAEYEILMGAQHELENHAFGVVVETWTTEIHKNQRLSGDVLVLMRERGFELFDVGIAAAWQRRSASRLPRMEKSQVVGLDLLFLKEATALGERPSFVRCAKAAAIADLYGFPDLAVEYLDRATESRAADSMRALVAASLMPPRVGSWRVPPPLRRVARSIVPGRFYAYVKQKLRGRRRADLHYY